MNKLKQFDFNKPSGWVSVIFVSIAISLLIFAGVYLFEGIGWLDAAKEEPTSSAGDIGWNWIRGAGISATFAVVLMGISVALLKKNKKMTAKAKPLFNHLDLNSSKGLLGLVSLSVSFVFFLNAGIYRIEVVKWFAAALATAQEWYFTEASAWLAASTTMAIIGIVLSALGWTMIALAWHRK